MKVNDVTVLIHPTIEELADEFINMNGEGQAEFIMQVSRKMSNWGPHDYGHQLCGIAQELGTAPNFITHLYDFIKEGQ